LQNFLALVIGDAVNTVQLRRKTYPLYAPVLIGDIAIIAFADSFLSELGCEVVLPSSQEPPGAFQCMSDYFLM